MFAAPVRPVVLVSQYQYYVFTPLTSRQCLYVNKRIKTAQVNLRILPELKEAAERAASDDQRSLTSLVEKLLTDHLRKNGYLPKPE